MREEGSWRGHIDDGLRRPVLARSGGRAAILAGALLAGPSILLQGCGEATLPVDMHTGVETEVRKGPLSPVAREGEEDTAPVEGAVLTVRTASGRPISRGETDSLGVAVFFLPPGGYFVSVRECPGAMSLPGDQAVEVRRGLLARATFLCDTGIR